MGAFSAGLLCGMAGLLAAAYLGDRWEKRQARKRERNVMVFEAQDMVRRLEWRQFRKEAPGD